MLDGVTARLDEGRAQIGLYDAAAVRQCQQAIGAGPVLPNVNIDAISTGDTVDHNVIRLVVSDTDKAITVFHEHNTMAIETEVLLVEGDNKPGMLGDIAEKLAAAKINIEYCYCATSPSAKKGLLVIRASNTKKAMKALNS